MKVGFFASNFALSTRKCIDYSFRSKMGEYIFFQITQTQDNQIRYNDVLTHLEKRPK